MLKLSIILIVSAALVSFIVVKKKNNVSKVYQQTQSLYSFTLKTLDGKDLNLGKFKGKKLLIVNVASECGFTPQYKNLQALHEKYGDKLVILGFPANDFGGQEPGDSKQIESFCTKNYGVTFQMMEKVAVKGDKQHAIYKWLSTPTLNGSCNDLPKWNFSKYLIDENGKILKFFGSRVDPLSEEITSLL
jgi:glutathione peroxidase